MTPTFEPALKTPVAKARSRREVAGFAEAECESGSSESDWSRGKRMGRGSERPDNQIQRVADAGSDTIDEPAGKQKTDRVGERERRTDPAVVAVGPPDLVP